MNTSKPSAAETQTNAGSAILGDLNPQQQAAVLHPGGPVLIIAGAGTGKTTVITRRIAQLIATKAARPEEILALTFTDKAAAEMQERVDVLVPYGYVDIWISTFHAFGDQILREQAALLGLSADYRVLTRPEQIVFLRRHLYQLALERFRPMGDPLRYLPALATLFSRAKDEDVAPEEYAALVERLQARAASAPGDAGAHGQLASQRELAEAYRQYIALLRHADFIDFGDQIVLTLQLFRRHPEVLQHYRSRFRYILVDEFQDTNYAQFELIKLLAPPDANLTIVADDDQSIYKFRGAAISNIVQFLEHYPQARQVVLSQNYRSTQQILQAAYRLIRFNDPERLEVKRGIDKRLVSAWEARGPEPAFHHFDTVSSEADWIAQNIRDAVATGGKSYRDFAILVRSNRDADPFLRAMNVQGVSWRFTGGTGLYGREEIRMLLSLLRLLLNPRDSLSLYHVASSALYRVPMADVAAALACAHKSHQPLWELLQTLDQVEELRILSATGRDTLQRLVGDLQAGLEMSRNATAGQVLYRLLQRCGYVRHLTAADTVEAAAAIHRIGRFFEILQGFETLERLDRLPELLTHLEGLLDAGDEPAAIAPEWDQPAVSVLTVHKAKGLEFSVVFLVGLVQGRFPVRARRDVLELPDALIKDLLPSGDVRLQEERRLFYVGMTRAKQALHLTAAQDYGGKSVRKVSQFVLEALDLPKPAAAPAATPPRAILARSQGAPAPTATLPPPIPSTEVVRLDAHRIDDYLTCPLKYKCASVLRLPILRHHAVVYGSALHKAIETYHRRRIAGSSVTIDDVLAAFESAWVSEGFLTREHEEQRLAHGRQVLRAWCAEEARSAARPTLIEERFSFTFERIRITGQWDRVDLDDDGAVIIDYKSSEITSQAEADRRAKTSVQLRVYAWAWQVLRGALPKRVELRFPETRLVGSATVTEEDLGELQEQVREVERGLRARAYQAQPSEHACRWCAYQQICPSAWTEHPTA
ncbi:MAG: ATP-dependent helicase [Candidatus Omnitrophica bacterium]|nr:ATP-dependent helicase [Candidatus Omnitrophota bacterium]